MKIAIIGGGVAGMFAAIAASLNKKNEILLVEKNEKLGKKLFISGKGRCNLTNACDRNEFFKNVVSNPKFLYSAFSKFSNEDLQKIIVDNGCELKVERGKRVFPVSDKSYDVIDAIKKCLKVKNISILLNTVVKDIKYNDNTFEIILSNNINNSSSKQLKSEINLKRSAIKHYYFDKVIITTGGLAYPQTGSTGDGYKFAEKFGINVVKQSPSLVPYEVLEVDDCKKMQGLTLKNVSIKVFLSDTLKNCLYSSFGELLITHYGLSGPIILSSSSYIDLSNTGNSKMILSIDLKPSLDEKQLDNRLLREFSGNNKTLKTVLSKLLPSSMIEVFIKRLNNYIIYDDNKCTDGIENIKCTNINKNTRNAIVNLLKDFRFTITKKRGFDEAIITKGGINVNEIDPKTMESKKIKGIYFAGEILDVDALTGGFNIQIAATTGYVAGLSTN